MPSVAGGNFVISRGSAGERAPRRNEVFDGGTDASRQRDSGALGRRAGGVAGFGRRVRPQLTSLANQARAKTSEQKVTSVGVWPGPPVSRTAR